MRLEIAHKAGVDPFEVSIGLLVQYAPQYAYEGRNPVEIFVARGPNWASSDPLAERASARQAYPSRRSCRRHP